MPTAIQPIERLERQVIVPSEMRTREWSRADLWKRERSFYMAGVANAEVLAEMRDIVRQSALGEAGEFEMLKEWEAFLDGIDYKPTPGQEGSIKDLRSLRRFNVALRTNRALMDGWAMRENGQRPGPLAAQPCWELVRIGSAKVPRDWPERWQVVGGMLRDGRMIAPKLDAIWLALGSEFEDALGTDHPPFAWGSGMGWRGAGARECVDLGVMTLEEIRAQAAGPVLPTASPNENLSMKPVIADEDLRDELAKDLRGLAEWRGEALVFTDPNGTHPVDDDELLKLWSIPLPRLFHDIAPGGLWQRQSVLDFAADPEGFAANPVTDQWDDLARAVGRTTDAARRDEVLARIADPTSAEWIADLLDDPGFGSAMELSITAARAVELIKLIRRVL